MTAPQNNPENASLLLKKLLALLLKKLLKKISPSRSTIKSWYQIFTALSITFVIVLSIAWLENEPKESKRQITSQLPSQTKTDKLTPNDYPNNTSTQIANPEVEESKDKKCEYKFNFSALVSTLICLISDLKLLAQVQNIAVISAASLFFLDTFDRKKQLERQAWQLIDGAQGAETSGARRQAIEDLHKEKSDITGLDADGADLRGIDLSGANLERASFKNAILEEANFEGATLTEANFTGANLKGAIFKKAKLWGADFTGADLTTFRKSETDSSPAIEKQTDLRDADLGFTTFNRALLDGAIFGVIDKSDLGKQTNLNGAKLRGVNLKNVNLNEACIAEARFGGSKIDINKIRKAVKYEEAHYSEDFCDDHKDEFKNKDIPYYGDIEFQQSITKKIVEISQRLLKKESLSLQDEESISDFVNVLNYLVILVKESNNQCLADHELSDKIIDLQKAFEEKQQAEQEVLRMIPEYEKKLADKEKKLADNDKELAEIDKETI
ncbi:MAG: pentapeptide repeat-containing protein [Microcoleus sp. PH2017_15_JOR_U_A]|uniref:pentapeptide repeat-containing protein n=1 Tax=unclassified Microcoleus TaxID=2642155 RepID=UPI001D72B69D|nr:MULTISPECIES: pentapeptide repeat-containing protein [unclassified Microcoleus]MCC3475605.1 pentapeptide repeat-containing protein [Microcoleus sp. PH2017_13_LAR_U_A]MCC3488089.1 pentapeptide repeat-containing protein [Microcoleus sp. PH2017_14_LAR_D_A]MCC3499991.1 pentapeptide repeat-containing protein [Microcoleus sp. PH2017_15_JOR_U_A]MCC3600704.1 pentapeptide repeat-containing protein [Microcoleus sp. PH2017_26_ELK_O_A]MCC3625840.1 pentapeptide repeat-containing protein [Microcoleus sp.